MDISMEDQQENKMEIVDILEEEESSLKRTEIKNQRINYTIKEKINI